MTAKSLLVLLALALLAPRADAQQAFLVALSNGGRVVVNDADLYRISSGSRGGMRDQAVFGTDLWHLCGDGRVYRNGAREFSNGPSFGTVGAVWIKIATDGNGNVFSLESTGRQTQQGELLAVLPNGMAGERRFVDMEWFNGALWSLRDDGRVYRGGTEFYDFDADPTDPRQTFSAMAIDPITNAAFALRRDGQLWSGPLTTLPGVPELVGDYPSIGGSQEEWMEIVFDEAGTTLWSIRRDGTVFSQQNPGGSGIRYVDYDGSGLRRQQFFTLNVWNGEPVSVRSDGGVFVGNDAERICRYRGSDYLAIDVMPNMPSAENARIFNPVVSRFTNTTCFEGDMVRFPILVSSVSANTFTFDATEVPAWGSFDTQVDPPVFTGIPTESGSYRLTVEVDDGLTRVRSHRYQIRVQEPDTIPERNQKPRWQRLQRVQAIEGVEITVPLQAFDADGDALTFTVGDLPKGMVFDDGSQTGSPSITWTAPLCAEDARIDFFADDGRVNKPVRRRVRIQTRAALSHD